MGDLPLILSLAANAVIAGLGYLGVRQQNATARHGIDAHSLREDASRQEEHLRHRQAVYHDYLDAFRALTPLMLVGPHDDLDRLLAWRERYEHCLNAVVLFGDEHVRETADDLHLLLTGVRKNSDGGILESSRAIAARFEELGPELAEQFRLVVAAMRADMAPGLERT